VKLRVFWFGRRGPAAVEEQVETYRGRIRRRWPTEDRMLKPAAGGRDADARRALAREAAELDRVLADGHVLVALSETGRQMTSEAFARWLAGTEDRSSSGIDFAIGSDLGLDPGVTARAALELSLSPMTLPHQLARLVLWEQLFRATHILGGGRYHRGNVQ
jgi:23S rRNA (pseudouridine1915-N3)-methyltransferase